MLKIFDVRCSEGHVTEDWVESREGTTTCSVCGSVAKPIYTPIAFHLDGASGHFPTATDRWIKDREKGAKAPEEE